MEELINHCFGSCPEGSWSQLLKLNPGAGVLGQIVSGSFNFYMSLEETEAELATNPVASQPTWLLSFLLSSRGTTLTLSLALTTGGMKEAEEGGIIVLQLEEP